MGRKARLKNLAREERDKGLALELCGAEQGRPAFPLLRVTLTFAALVLGFNLIYWTALKPGCLLPLQLATARVVAVLVRTSGILVEQQGTSLFLSGAHWEIVAECTAYSAAIVFVSFLLAYPSTLRAKGFGALLGLPFLFAANVLRLVVLAWAERLAPRLATVLHDYVWQVAFLFLLVMMWLFWIEWIVKGETSAAVSG